MAAVKEKITIILKIVAAPGHEALVDAVVVSLQVENLKSLLARRHPGTSLRRNDQS